MAPLDLLESDPSRSAQAIKFEENLIPCEVAAFQNDFLQIATS
jgi:hypothetical protein